LQVDVSTGKVTFRQTCEWVHLIPPEFDPDLSDDTSKVRLSGEGQIVCP
jgi:hypothetical protein